MRILDQYKKILTGHDFYRDVSYTAIGQFIAMALMLILNKLVSHYFSPAEYTIYSIANKTAGVLAFLMLFGLGIALPTYLARIRVSSDKRREANFFYSTLLLVGATIMMVSLLTLTFKKDIAHIVFNNDQHIQLIIPTLIFAIGITLSTFVYSYYRGVDKFKQYNISQIIFQALSVLIVAISGANLINQLTARGIIISSLSASILAYFIFKVYKHIHVDISVVKSYTKTLLSYCAPRVPGEIFLFSYSVVPLIIINTRFGSNTAAAFATAVTLLALVVPVFQFIGMTLLPYVSKNLAQGKLGDITNVIRKLKRLYITTSLISLLIMLTLTELIITILFSSEYTQFAWTVRIVQLSVLPYALYLLLRNPLDAISHKPINTMNLGISFTVLVVTLLLAPNALICSIAFPVSYTVLGVLSEISWRNQFNKYKTSLSKSNKTAKKMIYPSNKSQAEQDIHEETI